MLVRRFRSTNNLRKERVLMKMLLASAVASVVWYGLLACVLTVLLLCTLVLSALMLAGSIVAGGPVLLCWYASRFLRRKKDAPAIAASAVPVRPAE